MNCKWELDWVGRVDPNKVYDVLIKFAGAPKNESSRSNFVSSWNMQDLNAWEFVGDLGFGVRIWRGAVGFQGTGIEPTLYVNCCHEHKNEKTEKIIDDANKELLKILVEARLI